MASSVTKLCTSGDRRETSISDVETYVNDVISITSGLQNYEYTISISPTNFEDC
jgi:hypothetical protein